MRTRNRTVIVSQAVVPTSTVANGTWYDCSNVAHAYTQTTGFTVDEQSYDECIKDDVGKSVQHAVIHRRRTIDSSITRSLGAYMLQGPGPGYVDLGLSAYQGWRRFGSIWTRSAGISDFDVPNPTGTKPPPVRWSFGSLSSGQESILKENCFEKAKQLKADVLLDIVEGNQIWPAIASIATALPRLKQNWGSIRKVVKTASDAYLAWKFGINPLISDATSINKHLPKMGSDIAKHESSDTQRFSSFAELPVSFDPTPPGVGSQYGYTIQAAEVKGVVVKPPLVRYVLLVRPNVQYKTALFKKLDYLLSRFATSPADLAWELVPFSFVVDWFVDLRGFLRQLDNMLGFEPYKIVALSRSYQYDLRTDVTMMTYRSCPGNALTFKGPAGWVEFKHYERSPVSITPNLVSWKPRFGNNQAGISAALIGQYLGKLTK
jgi:hypothetical protein